MNQDSLVSNEHLHSFQIVNNIPKTQALVLQNTNQKEPIQLRVDPVTDYTALGITVFVSIITALLSAIVTICIVTRSNRDLIKNENAMQSKFLANERKKELDLIIAKNRQNWINAIREDIAKVTTKTKHTTHNLRAILQTKRDDEKEDYSDFILKYQEVEELIIKIELFLNRNKEDQISLIQKLNDLKSNLFQYSNLNLQWDKEYYLDKSNNILALKNSLDQNVDDIKIITQDIIKTEWEKSKTGS